MKPRNWMDCKIFRKYCTLEHKCIEQYEKDETCLPECPFKDDKTITYEHAHSFLYSKIDKLMGYPEDELNLANVRQWTDYILQELGFIKP